MRWFRNIFAASITIILFNVSDLATCARGESGGKTINSDSVETYFGQTPPGAKAEPFAPEVLIHEAHDSPVIPPTEDWLLFQGMDIDVLFYGMANGRFTATENPLAIEFPDICNGVAISPSGNRLYIEEWKDGQSHLYYVDRGNGGWTSPTYIDWSQGTNWWQISIALNGSLYLASDRVMVSRVYGDAHFEPEPLRLENDIEMVGGYPFIAPDESYIIYSIEGNLCISYRNDDGKWTMPHDLGPNINSNQLEICPQITPNGKYLLFATRRNYPLFSIYWAKADFVEELKPER